MKIKVALFSEEDLEGNPGLQAALEAVGIDPRKPPYIEFDTAGQFDELSEERWEHLVKAIEPCLIRFGQLLLSGINSDFALQKQGLGLLTGLGAIFAGLEEMKKQLEVTIMIARSFK